LKSLCFGNYREYIRWTRALILAQIPSAFDKVIRFQSTAGVFYNLTIKAAIATLPPNLIYILSFSPEYGI
jgi:hypothetical protein